MTSQVKGLNQAQRNANDGISVAQTADGALNQVNENLQRIRELTVQAQNGTNSREDLQSIQDEIGQRLTEIDRISGETDFNGVKVLASDQKLQIQVGANDGEVINVNLQEITKAELGLGDFRVTKNALNVSNEIKYVRTDSNFVEADLSGAVSDLTTLLGKSVNINDLTLRQVESADGTGTAVPNEYVIEYEGELYVATKEAADGAANAENFRIASVEVDGKDQAVKYGINLDANGLNPSNGPPCTV